ncbi:MAG: transporter ATP-binding protein [Ilumatobacteraceae bacterium]|nr:transporter ATP-binding protein [Ilumatobacteraceae bacterium]
MDQGEPVLRPMCRCRPDAYLHRVTSSLIDIARVSRTYSDGSVALDDVSLQVVRGESVAIVGPSGSGKSTLLNLIAGLDRPTAGSVTVDGVVVSGLGEKASALYRRRTIGIVFQSFNLLDDLTVIDNVALPARLMGTSRRAAARRANELLGSLGLADRRDAYPGRLSGGERQRVAVARALMNEPALLLADEPTGALDSAARAEVGRLLADLHAAGHTLVIVTHDEEFADRHTQRTIRLADGRVVGATPAGASR